MHKGFKWRTLYYWNCLHVEITINMRILGCYCFFCAAYSWVEGKIEDRACSMHRITWKRDVLEANISNLIIYVWWTKLQFDVWSCMSIVVLCGLMAKCMVWWQIGHLTPRLVKPMTATPFVCWVNKSCFFLLLVYFLPPACLFQIK